MSPRILRVFRLYAASYFGETHAILFYEHRAIGHVFFAAAIRVSIFMRLMRRGFAPRRIRHLSSSVTHA